jgi:hypothetical protein
MTHDACMPSWRLRAARTYMHAETCMLGHSMRTRLACARCVRPSVRLHAWTASRSSASCARSSVSSLKKKIPERHCPVRILLLSCTVHSPLLLFPSPLTKLELNKKDSSTRWKLSHRARPLTVLLSLRPAIHPVYGCHSVAQPQGQSCGASSWKWRTPLCSSDADPFPAAARSWKRPSAPPFLHHRLLPPTASARRWSSSSSPLEHAEQVDSSCPHWC